MHALHTQPHRPPFHFMLRHTRTSHDKNITIHRQQQSLLYFHVFIVSHWTLFQQNNFFILIVNVRRRSFVSSLCFLFFILFWCKFTLSLNKSRCRIDTSSVVTSVAFKWHSCLSYQTVPRPSKRTPSVLLECLNLQPFLCVNAWRKYHIPNSI